MAKRLRSKPLGAFQKIDVIICSSSLPFSVTLRSDRSRCRVAQPRAHLNRPGLGLRARLRSCEASRVRSVRGVEGTEAASSNKSLRGLRLAARTAYRGSTRLAGIAIVTPRVFLDDVRIHPPPLRPVLRCACQPPLASAARCKSAAGGLGQLDTGRGPGGLLATAPDAGAGWAGVRGG